MEINSTTLTNRKSFAVLDIGSSKLKCISFSLNKNNDITILAKSEQSSNGIKGGSLLNVTKARETINQIIETVEKNSEENIDEIFVNFSDCGMQAKVFRAKIDINNKKVTENEILLLKKQVYAKLELPVIHIIPIDYHIDGVQEVSNPIGMYGKTLSASFQVITAFKTLLLNLENCLAQCSLKLKGCSVSAYTAALACLSPDDKELGTAVIDIGGYYTAIGIFQQGSFIYAFSLPIGGIHISRDIACGLNINFAAAEQVKKTYSNILLESDAKVKIDLSAISESVSVKEVGASDIMDISKPRIEEILEMIEEKIKGYNLSQVILTGGGSKIANIEKLAAETFKLPVRLKDVYQFHNYNCGPEYSAAIGLLKLLQEGCRENNANNSGKSYFSKIMKVLNLG